MRSNGGPSAAPVNVKAPPEFTCSVDDKNRICEFEPLIDLTLDEAVQHKEDDNASNHQRGGNEDACTDNEPPAE